MLINFDLFPAGTVVFEQLPGVRFPTTPRVVATGAGTRALSNARPGEEFNPQPLRIDFTEEQGQVSVKAGLAISSAAPINATFRAFDQTGTQVAQDGPRQVGPGPVPAETVFQVRVSPPTIRRVELRYSGAFAELIDDLEFDVEGVLNPPDVSPPVVTIVRPENGATLTGESFILEATITEDRRLSEVLLTIRGEQGSVTGTMSHSGQAPNFSVGPVSTHRLALGFNEVTLTARDFAGNEGRATVSVNRVPWQATLVLPEQPIVLRRLPFRNAVEVRLQETFPGSLDGRDDIDIKVAGPIGVRGQVRIRDFLNQPEPRATLEIFARPEAHLGEASVFILAVEADTGRIITTADLLASVVPTNPLECVGTIPYYRAANSEEVRREMEAGIDAAIADKPHVSPLSPLQVTFVDREIRIFRRFHVAEPHLGFPTADINMNATIVRNSDVPFADLALAQELDEEQLPFKYQSFRVNASPNVPVIDPSTAIAWGIAQPIFESIFSDNTRTTLIRNFNTALFQRITAANENAHLFLRETRINTLEFMLGFCIPANALPDPLHADDFSSDPLENFEVVDDPQAVIDRPSAWVHDLAGRRLLQRSNIHGPVDNVNTSPNKPGTYLVGVHERQFGGGPWPAMSNLAMEGTLSSEDDDGLGLLFRYQDVDNFYFFLMDAHRRYRRIGKKVGGIFQDLQASAVDTGNGFEVAADHHVLLTAQGDRFSVHIDGVLALSGSDRAISGEGRIGLYAWGNSAARFQRLKIRPI
jgi:hypothetical protein